MKSTEGEPRLVVEKGYPSSEALLYNVAVGNDFDHDTVTELSAVPVMRGPTRRFPTLVWKDREGDQRLVVSKRVVLGQATGADVTIADSTVSRLHAELEPTPEGLWVRDLESRNGTWVGEVLVNEARLADGSGFRVGSTSFWVTYEGNEDAPELWPDERFGPLMGRSTVMRELFRRLAQVAPTRSTVLVQGETGTGKELVAQAIHEASPRADGPFVVVDCAGLPPTLIEAELFGHTRGAFTGAERDRAGAIETAHGGTLFLDEVGELALTAQPKLLRALESRQVRRLGENHFRTVDVRVVSATHRDIRRMVNSGAFREDLYFRLSVIPIHLPPLRVRPDDIPLLVEVFTSPGTGPVADAELLRELVLRPWPGNVRELRNFVERLEALGPVDALAVTPQGAIVPPQGFPELSIERPFKQLKEAWMSYLEREYLSALLERHGGNVSAVALAAGLDRSHVHRLIRRHDLGRQRSEGER